MKLNLFMVDNISSVCSTICFRSKLKIIWKKVEREEQKRTKEEYGWSVVSWLKIANNIWDWTILIKKNV